MCPAAARKRSARHLVAAALAALSLAEATGCSQLLPRADVVTLDSWTNYEEAQAAIDRIIPYVTRRAELDAAQIEPRHNSAITILSYSDIVQRLAITGSIKPEEMDAGVRDCLRAGKQCTGYAILLHRTNRDRRVGNFWLDSLNFRRETNVTGWTFNALVLFVDDLVVYTLSGGQPAFHERELTVNPLGPLQGWSDTVVPAIVK